MEIINFIQSLLNPALYLFLAIFSAIMLRRSSGGIFLAIGFGISCISSVIWRIVPLCIEYYKIPVNEFYKIFGFVEFGLFVVIVVFWTLGIIFLAKSVSRISKTF